MHESVPESVDESHNEVVKTWGEQFQPVEHPKHHHELLAMIDGYEAQRGANVAGHRGYFLKVGWRLCFHPLLPAGIFDCCCC